MAKCCMDLQKVTKLSKRGRMPSQGQNIGPATDEEAIIKLYNALSLTSIVFERFLKCAK